MFESYCGIHYRKQATIVWINATMHNKLLAASIVWGNLDWVLLKHWMKVHSLTSTVTKFQCSTTFSQCKMNWYGRDRIIPILPILSSVISFCHQRSFDNIQSRYWFLSIRHSFAFATKELLLLLYNIQSKHSVSVFIHTAIEQNNTV